MANKVESARAFKLAVNSLITVLITKWISSKKEHLVSSGCTKTNKNSNNN